MPRLARFAPCLVAVVLATAPALAQDSNEELYDRAFQEGLRSLSARRLDESIRLFGECVRIYPDRPVSYYNLACAFSLKQDPARAVEFLRQSFEKGFQDLAHMGRDMDLEPIRRSPAYRKAMGEFEEKLLALSPEPLSALPDSAAGAPLLVFVHDGGDDPRKGLETMQGAFPGWAVLAPRGVHDRARDVYLWDQRGEFLVTQRLRAFLAAHQELDRRRVVIVGEGVAGRLALSVAVHNPDLISGALVAGEGLHVAVDDVDLAGSRAYLVVHERNPSQVAGGELARDAFARAGRDVVLERYKLDKPLSKDQALLLRGVAWLQGKEVTLPGAGAEREF
ncbi:MAG: hypothetical protein AB7N76_27645 [Planctomycetota bacterium]